MREALQVVKGKNQGHLFLLRHDGQTVIGRSDGCEIQLDDTSVSRRHFCVEKLDNKYFLKDMGSSNGTFVNGNRTLWQELSLGDQVYCGASQLKFVLLEDGKNVDFIAESEYPPTETQPEPEPEPDANTANMVDKIAPITGKHRRSRFRLSSPTQPLQQIKPGLFHEEMAEQKFDLADIQTQSIKDTPDIIYQKTRRDAPFAHYKDANRIGKALSTLYKVSELLHSQLDLEKLLDTLLKTILSITSAQRGCLLLKKSKDSELKIAVFRQPVN